MNNDLNYQRMLGNPFSFPGILMNKYVSLGLNETEMMVILHICFFQQQGIMFPTTDELAKKVTLSERDVALILRKLVQRNLLQIEDVQEDNMRSQAYSLNGLWHLAFAETVYPEPEKKKTDKEEEAAIFILFEQEFGRPLSPFEIETVTLWLDEDMQPPSLIKAALREAVLMSKLNFRYIDRILREWKRKGIRSVDQARKQSKSFHENQRPTAAAVRSEQQAPTRDVSIYYNWLEED